MNTATQQHTIAGQAAGLSNSEFTRWLEKRQSAQSQIFERLGELVNDDFLDPIAGARIAACVSGSVFGYEEFHPRAGQPTAELMLDSDLLSGVKPQSR